MASTSTLASAEPSSSTSNSSRPQAGPLPTKRGEIGFLEGIHASQVQTPCPVATPLPARHPADRDPIPPQTLYPANRPLNSTLNDTSTSATASTDDISSTSSLGKQKKTLKCLRLLKPKKVPSYGGLRLTTLLAFLVQLAFISGTVTAWVFSSRLVARSRGEDNSSETNEPPAMSSAIFIHIVFGIATLGQLLFIERRIFRLRAERYAYKHPGEILPSSRRRGPDPRFPLSPWNRPPLPTYAAALAQSGVGTGDVEDHLIAVQPPPAYGNTRGSTLILAGFLRNSLRAQRPLSTHTVVSQQNERPVSYASHDAEWEAIQDADRARQLEETLATLERPGVSRQ